MGDRGQVHILNKFPSHSPGVWLYTHWGATELPMIVQRAMKRRLRWDDDCYLARIIFCEMIADDINGELGFGIDTDRHGDSWRAIHIDTELQKITIEDGFEDDNYGYEENEWTFEEYITANLKRLCGLAGHPKN